MKFIILAVVFTTLLFTFPLAIGFIVVAATVAVILKKFY